MRSTDLVSSKIPVSQEWRLLVLRCSAGAAQRPWRPPWTEAALGFFLRAHRRWARGDAHGVGRKDRTQMCTDQSLRCLWHTLVDTRGDSIVGDERLLCAAELVLVSAHLVHAVTLWSQYHFYYSNFTDGETESLREVTDLLRITQEVNIKISFETWVVWPPRLTWTVVLSFISGMWAWSSAKVSGLQVKILASLGCRWLWKPSWGWDHLRKACRTERRRGLRTELRRSLEFRRWVRKE